MQRTEGCSVAAPAADRPDVQCSALRYPARHPFRSPVVSRAMNGIVKSLAMAVAVGIAALYSIEAVRYCVRVLKWLPGHERWARAREGLCPNCGYDLNANVSGTCPECGEIVGEKLPNSKVSLAPSLITEKRPWWVWGVVVAMIALAVIFQRLLWL